MSRRWCRAASASAIAVFDRSTPSASSSKTAGAVRATTALPPRSRRPRRPVRLAGGLARHAGPVVQEGLARTPTASHAGAMAAFLAGGDAPAGRLAIWSASLGRVAPAVEPQAHAADLAPGRPTAPPPPNCTAV